jgi:aspartate/methionine/tyrosine aminotransferase
MRIETFRMERMQCLYEHEVEYNLSESGVQPMTLEELLGGQEALRSLLRAEIGYPQSNGSLPLRERIASLYPGADPDNVTVVNGGSEANYIALWTLLEGGDRLAFMLPNYMQGWGLGRHFGAGSDAFRLRVRREAASSRWALDIDGLERAVSRDTRAILVTNPNNPTGSVLTEEEMDAVVRVAKRARAWLVADEIYRGAELDSSLTPTFWGQYDKLVVTSGLSKAFGLPGLRIGWMVAPHKLIEKLWIHHDYTTLTPGALSQHLAALALDPFRRDAILSRTTGILRRNLPLLEEWIRSHGELFDYIRPSAGAIALVKYDLPIRSGVLIDRIREEQSVLVVPGDQLGLGKYMRIGYGSDAEFMLKALSRVDETLAHFSS